MEQVIIKQQERSTRSELVNLRRLRTQLGNHQLLFPGRQRIHIALGVGIATLFMVVEEAPQSLHSVAIDAESLVFRRSQKHVTVRWRWLCSCLGGQRGCVWIVAGETGDGSGARPFPATVEGWHVPWLLGTSAVYQSHLRVIHVFWNAFFRALALTVAARAERAAEVTP